MQVRDVMTTRLVAVPPYTSVTAVAAEMRDADVGCVLVIGEDTGRRGGAGDSGHGGLHGLITDRDLAVRVLAEGGMAGQMTAREVASGDLVTVSPDATLCRAAELMCARALRRLPVTDENGRAVGILSLGDMARTPHAQEVLATLTDAYANH